MKTKIVTDIFLCGLLFLMSISFSNIIAGGEVTLLVAPFEEYHTTVHLEKDQTITVGFSSNQSIDFVIKDSDGNVYYDTIGNSTEDLSFQAPKTDNFQLFWANTSPNEARLSYEVVYPPPLWHYIQIIIGLICIVFVILFLIGRRRKKRRRGMPWSQS